MVVAWPLKRCRDEEGPNISCFGKNHIFIHIWAGLAALAAILFINGMLGQQT